MSETDIKDMLCNVIHDYKVIRFLDCRKNDSNEAKYVIDIECKSFGLEGDTNIDKTNLFIKKFSSLTNTNWKSIKKFHHSNYFRYFFRKQYICKYAGLGPRKLRATKNMESKTNFKCRAKINIMFIKIKSDESTFNALGFLIRININFCHTHNVKPVSAEVLNIIKSKLENKNICFGYFQSGMGKNLAILYHEFYVLQKYNERDTAYVYSQLNLIPNCLSTLYHEWKEEKRTKGYKKESTIDSLKRRKLENPELTIEIKTDPFIVVVITPLMKRICQLNLIKDILYVDSTALYAMRVILIFAATKVGALPICLIFLKTVSESQLIKAFNTAKHILLDECGIRLTPKYIMTDNNPSERDALKMAFPDSILLLCSLFVTQAVWKSLCYKSHSVEPSERKLILKLFQNVMNAKTEEEANKKKILLYQYEAIKENRKMIIYFSKYWSRRNEWCAAYRFGITEFSKINIFCDMSVKIFKDLILQKCKAFNISVSIQFFYDIMEKCHISYILRFVSTPLRLLEMPYIKFEKLICDNKNINKINDTTFEVINGKETNASIVHSDLGVCDCHLGQKGTFCRHIYAVYCKYNSVFMEPVSLTDEEKKVLAQLTLSDMEVKSEPVPDIEDIKQEPDEEETSELTASVNKLEETCFENSSESSTLSEAVKNEVSEENSFDLFEIEKEEEEEPERASLSFDREITQRVEPLISSDLNVNESNLAQGILAEYERTTKLIRNHFHRKKIKIYESHLKDFKTIKTEPLFSNLIQNKATVSKYDSGHSEEDSADNEVYQPKKRLRNDL